MKPSSLEWVKAPVNTALKRTELALCECSLVPLLSCFWSWFSSDGVSMVVFLPSSKNAFLQQILSTYLPLHSLLSFSLPLPHISALCSLSPSLSLLHIHAFSSHYITVPFRVSSGGILLSLFACPSHTLLQNPVSQSKSASITFVVAFYGFSLSEMNLSSQRHSNPHTCPEHTPSSHSPMNSNLEKAA